MRAAVMEGHGGPDELVVRDGIDLPECGPGDVRVAVSASSVNNTDIWTREGAYGAPGDPSAIAGWRGEPVATPRIQGTDAVGVVDAVGSGVSESWLGTRVLIDPAVSDGAGPAAELLAVMGSEFDGGFAEYVVVDAGHIHDVSASPLTDAQLATLPTAYGTAMGMLHRAAVSPGERLVATGASGGVGLAIVQLAAAMEVHVIALSTSDKTELLERHGAAAVVDRRSEQLVADLHRAAGDPVNVVADVVGGSLFQTWPGLLSRHGRIVVAGAIAGPIVALDLRQLYLGLRRIVGSTMHTSEDFARLVELANRGDIDPVVADTFPLEEIHAAQEAFRSPRTVGNIVITLSE